MCPSIMPSTEKPLGWISSEIPAEKYSPIHSTTSYLSSKHSMVLAHGNDTPDVILHNLTYEVENLFHYNSKPYNVLVRKCIFISFRIQNATEFELHKITFLSHLNTRQHKKEQIHLWPRALVYLLYSFKE